MSAEKVFNADISIHAPTRGATKCGKIRGCTMGFQSTLPRGERLAYHLLLILFLLFQSTLPRGERRLFLVFDLFHRKFQSTLPRGERLCRICHSNNIRKNFNPRSHEGSDHPGPATVNSFSLFQSTLPRGERLIQRTSPFATWATFQSTLPRGERLAAHYANEPTMLNFNPRSHEGSDRLRPSDPHSQRLFQSTLPRGERLDHQFISQDIPVFQSTLPRGERRKRSLVEI